MLLVQTGETSIADGKGRQAMKILVPLDGSSISEAILPTVAAVAGPLGAEVELLTVVTMDRVHETPAEMLYPETAPAAVLTGTRLEVPLMHELMPHPAETREQAVERLEAQGLDYLRAQTHALRGIATTVRVEFADHAAAAIIARARAEAPDLIAMATHGRTGLSHLLAGSVTEQVIRSGAAPVLTVRSTTGPASGSTK
jgi:nucleotide-binding universal stress UspA family protein